MRHTIDGMPVDSPEAAAAARADSLKRERRNVKKASLTPHRPDTYIWGIYLFLLLISVVELFSASSTEVTSGNVYAPLIRHCIFLGAGLGIVLLCQRIHYSLFRKLAWPLAIFSLLLLLAASFVGVSINGAQRAIRVAGITIQPPEIVKLTAILLLTRVLARYQVPGGVSNMGLTIASIIVFGFGVVVLPNGLTNLVILMGVSLCMMVIGGCKIRKMIIMFVIYGCAGGLILGLRSLSAPDKEFAELSESQTTEQIVAPAASAEPAAAGAASEKDKAPYKRMATQSNRFKRFLEGVSPTDTINDLNRQVIFSKFALAHGGVTGRGPGNSRESSRLPLAFSDYIYSIVVEDTGLIGGLGLLIIYLCLLGRAGIVASKCSRAFPALLIMGCALLIVLQALIHMAIVVGLAPVSGQPLPFISKGGTSILVMSAAIGMMLSVSRYAITGGSKREQRAEINTLPEEFQAANPMQISDK